MFFEGKLLENFHKLIRIDYAIISDKAV